MELISMSVNDLQEQCYSVTKFEVLQHQVGGKHTINSLLRCQTQLNLWLYKLNFRTLTNHLNSLPNDKILDWSEFKVFADDKINVTKKN